jgi:hypothetical protein
VAAAACQAASRLKAGCGQDWPLYDFMKLRVPQALKRQAIKTDGLYHR